MQGLNWQRRVAALALVVIALPARSFQAPPAGTETLSYGVEWRLIRAGAAKMTASAGEGGARQVSLTLRSAGLVNTLYRVSDDYVSTFAREFCTSTVFMHAEEGRRRRDTRITFDAERSKSSYLEQDLVKNAVAAQKEIDISPCTHDVIAGLYRLRSMQLEPGKTIQLPVSDGKKFVNVRV